VTIGAQWDQVLDPVVGRVAVDVMDLEEHGRPAADGWLRGAEQIADYIGSTRSRVYALTSAGRIPVEHDGAAIVAKRSTLDTWIKQGGDRCPRGGTDDE
jgi:excisionase family DNA binding protein